jgi:hypothetical protein
MLASRGRRLGHLAVQVVGHAQVDHVDVATLEQLPVVGLDGVGAQPVALSELLSSVSGAAGDGDDARVVAAYSGVGARPRLGDEAGTDDADAHPGLTTLHTGSLRCSLAPIWRAEAAARYQCWPEA